MSPNERAERLITEAEQGAFDHARRTGRDDEAAQLYQIELLEILVRRLCVEADGLRAAAHSLEEHSAHQRRTIADQGLTITRLRNQNREQAADLQELRFRLIADDDFEQKSEDLRRQIAAFNRSTGAAAALQGGQR